MERLVTSGLKAGIIAGGQLGKMIIREASKWDIITYVLGQDDQCPARSIVMGSESDLPVMQQAADMLKPFGIRYEIDIVSAQIISVANTAVRNKIIGYKAELKEQVLQKSKGLGG